MSCERGYLHVLVHYIVCKFLVTALPYLFELLAVHLGDLEEDVGLFKGVDLPGQAKHTILLMGSHPGRRQIKVLLLQMLRVLQARRRVKQRWTVKDLNTTLLYDLTELSIEGGPVKLLRHQLFLYLSFLGGRNQRYLVSVDITFNRL